MRGGMHACLHAPPGFSLPRCQHALRRQHLALQATVIVISCDWHVHAALHLQGVNLNPVTAHMKHTSLHRSHNMTYAYSITLETPQDIQHHTAPCVPNKPKHKKPVPCNIHVILRHTRYTAKFRFSTTAGVIAQAQAQARRVARRTPHTPPLKRKTASHPCHR